MIDRRGIEVDAGHRHGNLREKRAPVAFATSCIQDAATAGEAARKRVPVHMLVDDLARHAGHEALSGEF